MKLIVLMQTLSAWNERLNSWGYKPLFCSVETKTGLAALEKILQGQTTVIAGPSGVGKSSLINTLRNTQHIKDEEEMSYLKERVSISYGLLLLDLHCL